jgi:hypothetical protein
MASGRSKKSGRALSMTSGEFIQLDEFGSSTFISIGNENWLDHVR